MSMTLRRSDKSFLKRFNEQLFPDLSVENEIFHIKSKIQKLREEVLQHMEKLDRLQRYPKVSVFTDEMLDAFFNEYPAMSIVLDDCLQLISRQQCVHFHVKHGSTVNGINDDVLYVTFPLYSFTIKFLGDGTVSVKHNDFVNAEALGASSNDINYGHPNASLNNQGEFRHVCTGNNDFITDYREMWSRSATKIIHMLSKAAIWLRTANLDDMYNTSLTPYLGMDISSIHNAEFIDAFFRIVQKDTLGDEFEELLSDSVIGSGPKFASVRDVYDSYKESGARRRAMYHALLHHCGYSMWLWLHWNEVLDTCPRHLGRSSLYNAIVTDVMAMTLGNHQGAGLWNFSINNEFFANAIRSLQSPMELKLCCGEREGGILDAITSDMESVVADL